MKKVFLSLILLLPAITYASYEEKPTKQDLVHYFQIMKLVYSDMPVIMQGMEYMIKADFNLELIKDKQALCDMLQARKRVNYISSTAKVHPYFQKEVDNLKESFADSHGFPNIRNALAASGVKCL